MSMTTFDTTGLYSPMVILQPPTMCTRKEQFLHLRYYIKANNYRGVFTISFSAYVVPLFPVWHYYTCMLWLATYQSPNVLSMTNLNSTYQKIRQPETHVRERHLMFTSFIKKFQTFSLSHISENTVKQRVSIQLVHSFVYI